MWIGLQGSLQDNQLCLQGNTYCYRLPWTWVDSTTYQWKPWKVNEPGADETCAVLNPDGEWEGLRCDQYAAFVCEKGKRYKQLLISFCQDKCSTF